MRQAPVTPSGLLRHANEFLHAAELVLKDSNEVSIPSYFLFGRSIELSFKAFLLSRGMRISELKSKKFGHDLSALLDEALSRGIGELIVIDELAEGVIRLLSEDYLNKRFEYRETGGIYLLPLINVTKRVAKELSELTL